MILWFYLFSYLLGWGLVWKLFLSRFEFMRALIASDTDKSPDKNKKSSLQSKVTSNRSNSSHSIRTLSARQTNRVKL